MPKVQCSVVGCYNGSYRLCKWKRLLCPLHGCMQGTASCTCDPPFILYLFPSERQDPGARKVWIQNINRKDNITGKIWQPQCYSRVCSDHFIDGKPSEHHPYPAKNMGKSSVPAPRTQSRRKLTKHPLPPKRQRLGQDVSDGAEVQSDDPTDTVYPQDIDSPGADDSTNVLDDQPICTLMDHGYSSVQGCDCEKGTHCLQCHTKLSKIEDLESTVKQLLDNSNTTLWDSLLTSDKMVRFYTGLPTKAVLNLLFDYAEPKVTTMHYWRGSVSTAEVSVLSPVKKRGRMRKLGKRDELLLTLMKLRLGLLTTDLAIRFKICESTVSSIFTTWIKVLASLLEPLVKMHAPECIRANLPTCFRRYKHLRGILDCTEVFIETPRDLKLQALTWSDYKKHNTIKLLVVITPRGRIGFISKAWGGRASDRHIVQKSGFLDTVEPYDLYMADRGFTIADDLLMKYAELVIPPGGRGKEQMSGADVQKTKVVANLRIHVERAIERLKRFKILKGTMPVTLLSLSDDIIMACAGLCNLLNPLVK